MANRLVEASKADAPLADAPAADALTANTGLGDLVLIHGAWQGGWAFGAWAPWLEALGWRVHAVDLPGSGWGPAADAMSTLETCTDHVAAIIDRLPGPVVVLGHSGGGLTASQVAERVPDRVAGVVYLAGMMLPTGRSFADLLNDAALAGADVTGIGPWLDWNAGRTHTTVRPEGALRCFFDDCAPEAAAAAIARLRPQPQTGRDVRNRLTAERHGRVPRVYVECRDDRSVRLPVQRLMQALSPGALRLSLEGGHVPQLARPARLTERLAPALELLAAGRNPCNLPASPHRDHPPRPP